MKAKFRVQGWGMWLFVLGAYRSDVVHAADDPVRIQTVEVVVSPAESVLLLKAGEDRNFTGRSFDMI